jgi:hypothetical protein
VELTVSSEVRAKLERVKNLMLHRNPTGDLERIFETALDLLVMKLEKERLGKTTRPRREKNKETPQANEGQESKEAEQEQEHRSPRARTFPCPLSAATSPVLNAVAVPSGPSHTRLESAQLRERKHSEPSVSRPNLRN